MPYSASASAGAPPLPAVQRYFEVSLCLLVATGVLAVVSTGKLDVFTTVLCGAALAVKGIRLWRLRGPELTHRVATWLVLAYFLFFPIDLWVVSRDMAAGAPNPALYAALLAAIHLMLFATLVRLFSARSNRDYGFLAILAFTCMLSSAILTVDTSFIISLAIFLVVAVSTFVALEIRRSSEGAASPPVEAGSPLAQQLSRALGFISVLVAVAALIIGGALFFLIPRFTAGYLSALNLQPTLATGFTGSVTLGQIGQIKKNSAVVMRIRIDGDPARAADMHWRGVVLTTFDGRRWFSRPADAIIVSPSNDGLFRFNPAPLPPGDSFTMHYTALVEPLGTDAIFVAPRPVSLRGRFSDISARTGRRPAYLTIDRTGSVSNPFHNEARVRYEGASLVPVVPPGDLRSASADYPQEIRQTYLQLPALDPRIKKLADQITLRSKNEYDKAANLELYLKTHYAYTLDLAGPKVADPLAYFLFTRRAGHCEYFASAMTVMLRAEGIPARYVAGFLPGEYNDIGRDYIIRASDAHTWVEVFFPGYGWLTFDPTPPGNESRGGLLQRLSFYWDWFQFSWSEWVINYDFSHQMSLALNVRHSSHDWLARARTYYHREKRRAMTLLLAADGRAEASPYFLPGVLVILFALLFYVRGRAMMGYAIARWSLRASRRGNVTASLAALEYREMLRLLEKRGWKKEPAQTALEFASSIPAAELSAPVAQLTELYQSARFGNHPARAGQMSSLLRSIRDLLRNRQTISR